MKLINNQKKNWNLSREKAVNLIILLIEKVLDNNNNNISIQRLPIFLKKQYRMQNIKIKKNGNYRNINTYIKENYGSIEKFITKHNSLFDYKENIISIHEGYKKDKEDYIFI